LQERVSRKSEKELGGAVNKIQGKQKDLNQHIGKVKWKGRGGMDKRWMGDKIAKSTKKSKEENLRQGGNLDQVE